jgi:hypothetical protein
MLLPRYCSVLSKHGLYQCQQQQQEEQQQHPTAAAARQPSRQDLTRQLPV